VVECLRRHLSPHQRLSVGLSGGRDSVALLHAAHELQTALNFRLDACHVNHRLSARSDRWQEFCGELCDQLDVPLKIIAVDVSNSSRVGIEAAARAERYAAFGGLVADWILLGQHRGDQAETVLFNLLRGTGLAGASGMPQTRAMRPGLRLIRPLLGVARQDINDYLKKHDLKWVEDESNANTGFARNFLRHEIVPALQSRFPAAEETLTAAAARFAEALALLNDLASLDLDGAPPNFPIPTAILEKLTESRGRNLLRFLLVRHGVRIPSEARLIEALRQILYAGPDRHPAIDFGEWTLTRRGNEVYVDPCQGND